MFEIYDILIIPLILGVVELFKIGGMKAKFSPFVAVFFGIILGEFILQISIGNKGY